MQNKQKQAIGKFNRDVRQQNQQVKISIDKYNSEVRRYNARVRANSQKIASELRRIKLGSTEVRYQTIRTSAISLNSYYENLNSRESEFDNLSQGAAFLDLSERENANSLEVSNILASEVGESSDKIDPSLLHKTEINNMLASISPELNNRWKGALFSLNIENPDAARHFCTSAREIFIQILDINAPDQKVFSQYPNCETTEKGQPTRREKVKFLLERSEIISGAAIDFVDKDVKNILDLFRILNDGTHGASGRFGISTLMAIKMRVENCISYLATISDYV